MTGSLLLVKPDMSDETLARVICQQINMQPGEDVQFVWRAHAASAERVTLFRRIVELQQHYAAHRRVYNTFQTRDTMLDEAQGRFFKTHGWRVSLIVEDLPDLTENASSVHQATETLRSHDVDFTLVGVVNRDNCSQPQRLYRFLRGLGTPFLHFIPCQEMNDHQTPDENSVPAKAWGTFLREVFDVWVREDVGSVFVQLFDSTLRVWNGFSSPQCALNCTCGHNTLSEECRQCPVRRLCHGDCPEHWDRSGKSALCEGYREFFTYTGPYMKVMRDLIRHHRSPMELMVMLK